MKDKYYVIGVDGGGTKTVVALANLEGEILYKIESGPSNPYKVELKKAISNLKEGIDKVLKKFLKEKIGFIYIGLAGGLERGKERKEKIEKALKKEFPQFSKILKIEGDQKIAFRSGTNEKDGLVVISGTGSIAMGWRGKRKAIAGGWDWLLGDQGSGFWIGKRALEEVIKEIDGRREKTKILKDMIFKEIGIKGVGDLYKIFYSENFVEKISSVSKIVDKAAKNKDKLAIGILKEAGKELASAAISVIRKLNFKREKFPIVLAGSMFKSKTFLSEVKKGIKKFAPKAKFILLKKEPVIGAVKLAIENLK